MYGSPTGGLALSSSLGPFSKTHMAMKVGSQELKVASMQASCSKLVYFNPFFIMGAGCAHLASAISTEHLHGHILTSGGSGLPWVELGCASAVCALLC